MSWIRTEDGYVNLATAHAIIDTERTDQSYVQTRYRIIDGGGVTHNFVALPGVLEGVLEVTDLIIGTRDGSDASGGDR